MPPTEPPLAENSDTQEPMRGDFSPAYVASLLCENVRLREESGAWRARAITDRKDAHYYKRMHGKAVERLLEKDGQIEALKSKCRRRFKSGILACSKVDSFHKLKVPNM